MEEEEEVVPVKKEKTHFTVKLTELKAADKVKLIKEVKNCIQGLNLVQVCDACEAFSIVGDRKYKYSLDNTFTRVFQVIYHCCINDCSVLILSVLSVFPKLG